MQDSTKIDDLKKECEESTSLIPKLEESIPQFQKLLSDEEKILDEIQESSKGSLISCVCLRMMVEVEEYLVFVFLINLALFQIN